MEGKAGGQRGAGGRQEDRRQEEKSTTSPARKKRRPNGPKKRQDLLRHVHRISNSRARGGPWESPDEKYPGMRPKNPRTTPERLGSEMAFVLGAAFKAPRSAPGALHGACVRPPKGPGRPKNGPRRLNNASWRPKRAPKGPRPQEACCAKSLGETFNCFTYSFGCVQDGPRSTPDRPVTAQEAPKRAPRGPQEARKRPQKAPRGPQWGPQEAPGCPQEAPQRPPIGRLDAPRGP